MPSQNDVQTSSFRAVMNVRAIGSSPETPLSHARFLAIELHTVGVHGFVTVVVVLVVTVVEVTVAVVVVTLLVVAVKRHGSEPG